VKNCYKKAFRLKKQKEIAYLVKNGKRFNSKIFVVFYEKNGLKHDRFNVLVSKKNGGAVQRVRIKRTYREVYVNTEVEDAECFYDILARPSINCEHNFGEIKELYGKWRNETNKESSGGRNIFCDTVC
jgi:ribonuclease P protein component